MKSSNVYLKRSELKPSFITGFYEIPKFKEISGVKEIVYSEDLRNNNLIWKLKIYPNGNGVAKNEYISIFLELAEVISLSK
jgi:tripartite motif-containing protein 37